MNGGSLSGLTDALARQRGAGDLPVPARLAPTAAKPRSPVGFPSRRAGLILASVLLLAQEDRRP